MNLKFLSTCETVDFSSSIANFCPENGKNKYHSDVFKFDKNLNCSGEKFKNSKEMNFKNFSYVFLFKLRFSIYSCSIEVFSLEMVHQKDRNAQLQSAPAVSLLDVQPIDSYPPIVSPGNTKGSCCSSILNH